jgi:hypothetical protein
LTAAKTRIIGAAEGSIMPTIMTAHMRNTSGGEKASSTAPMSMPPMRASQAQASSVTPASPAAATTRSRFTSASTLAAGV